MSENYFTDTIKAHALKDAPNEACGLIFLENGTYVARPCMNVWLPEEERPHRFRIATNDVAIALRSRTLVATYHSHVTEPAVFTSPKTVPRGQPNDVSSADAMNLPSYLYSVKDDTFAVYNPVHAPQPLIGRPYVPMVYDCITLFQDAFREQLGIELPPLDYSIEESFVGKKQGIAEYFQTNGWRPVSTIRPFDLLLLIVKTHNYPNHIGMITAEEDTFLHHLRHKFSSVDPYGGFWKHATHVVMRHPSFFKTKP